MTIGNKEFDWHRLEHAEMINTPLSNSDEKNPFHLSVIASYELLNSSDTWRCHVERSETSLSISAGGIRPDLIRDSSLRSE